jgi:hypothetical protein
MSSLKYLWFPQLSVDILLEAGFLIIKIAARGYKIKGQFVASSLTILKVHFIPEHIIHVSKCTAHLNRTRFNFNTSQPAMFCRSAGCSQERIRSDRDLYVIYDVIGNTGWILGVPDIQSGRRAPKSSIQGPSGSFIWRILQAGCRGQHLHLQYIWSIKQIRIRLLTDTYAQFSALRR